jgi:uncharacterized repeat protein (TIGR03803 family)
MKHDTSWGDVGQRRGSLVRSYIIVAFVLVLSLCAGAAAAGSTFTLIRTFTGGDLSANSYGPLIADRAGNLYGTASTGGNGGCVRYGSTGCGTVFELTPPSTPGSPWTETVIYRFPGGNGPWFPVAGLARDGAGNLYGTTTDGGPYGCFTTYCGSVFELTPPSKPGAPWKEIVLYRFSSGAGGNNPGSGVTLDGKGNLYGTTETYGPLSRGTVFRLTRPATGQGWWSEAVLSGFDRGGNYPLGGVAFDRAGNLYGTTFYGGYQDLGVVFKLTPTLHGYWTETVLYEFGSNACSPKTDVLFDRHGNLFGTAQGCPALPGAVFRLVPRGGSWSESVLKYFNDGTNYGPGTTLLIDDAGNIYGTTAGGGSHLHGTVFKLAPPGWSETIPHSFSGSDGDFPTAGPIFGLGGALYGTTIDGGSRRGVCKIGGCGVLYRIGL